MPLVIHPNGHSLSADPWRDGRTTSEVPINEQLLADQGAPMEASQTKGQITHQFDDSVNKFKARLDRHWANIMYDTSYP